MVLPSASPPGPRASPKASAGLDPDLQAFGARVRALRQAAGMTQEDLAFASDLHWTYVSQIERGRRNLTYKSIVHLARGLHVAPELLMPEPT